MTPRLSRAALRELPASIRAPAYDVAQITPGIVHLGLGGFHRAHMARYTHELMERNSSAYRWGIIGAGLLAGDRSMRDALASQDHLYTLVERDTHGEDARVIGSLCDVVYAGEQTAALLTRISDPAIAIVSLTVTENGYCLDPATKRLNLEHPSIRTDIANPRTPASAIGVLVEAYRRRRDARLPGFTSLSCDNIQSNGEILRQAVYRLAELVDPSLLEWLQTQARFPSTMVDRITPLASALDLSTFTAQYQLADARPVFCETFSQWVIADEFVTDRPAWEQVGAQFVDDVEPYEYMKLRLLNASHLAIAGLARLAGAVHIDEAMRLPHMQTYMSGLMDRETGPTLRPVPGIDLPCYKKTLLERFANPRIRDTVDRVNADAPLNVLLDPIRDRLRESPTMPLLSLALAAWIRRFGGVDEAGGRIELRHPYQALLQERVRSDGTDPRGILGIEALFGEVGQSEALVSQVQKWLESMACRGVLATIERAIAS